MNIRPARLEDVNAITEIYNDAILKTVATFDTEPKTIEQQTSWLKAHGGKYPVLVVEEGEKVMGWASVSRWSDRRAYDDTGEVSIYVREDARGRGIGAKLFAELIHASREAGLHTMISRITTDGKASIRLHENSGFSRVGTLKEVGKKFGRLLDVLVMQKIL